VPDLTAMPPDISGADRSDLPVDELPVESRWLEVREWRNQDFVAPDAPHRHDYQEIIWTIEGEGTQLIDGEEDQVAAGSLSLIAKGQVHAFARADSMRSVVIRFDEAMLVTDGASSPARPWLFAGSAGRTLVVPEEARGELERLVALIAGQTARRPDGTTTSVQRHLLSALLALVEGWQGEALVATPGGTKADVALFARFAELLEQSYSTEHEVGFYADALSVSTTVLAGALSELVGKPTKRVIMDRVLLEAQRLLRWTDMSVKEISYAVGFADPFHFSRTFKRQYGRSPQEYRAAEDLSDLSPRD
jgi:AraC family transcriptional regulator, transcriptional activator of pobA